MATRVAPPTVGARGWPFFDPYYVPSGTTTETSIEIVGGERGGGVGGDDEDDCSAAVLTVVCPFRAGVHLQILEALESMQLDASRAKLAFEGGYVLDELDVPSGISDEVVLRFAEGSLMGLSDSSSGGGKALSRLAAILAELRCNVAAMEAWTRRGDRAACLLLLVDSGSHQPVQESWRRDEIRARLRRGARRRIHQQQQDQQQQQKKQKQQQQQQSGARSLLQGILDNIVDLVTAAGSSSSNSIGPAFDRRPGEAPCVTARICEQRRYVEVQVQLRDHPGLLLRSVRALADLGYQIFHASADRQRREEEQQMEALELVYAQKLDGSIPSEEECRTLEQMLQVLLSGEDAGRKLPPLETRAAAAAAAEDGDDDEKVFWDGDLLAVSFSRGCYWCPTTLSGGGKHFLNLLYISRTWAREKQVVRERMEQAMWELEAKDGLPDPVNRQQQQQEQQQKQQLSRSH